MTNPRVAVAAPNATAAEAGVRLAAEGGNAVDAAIAATLVTMVNEIGVVSPASGGFVTLQVAGGEPVTIDGWVEMPGRGLTGQAGNPRSCQRNHNPTSGRYAAQARCSGTGRCCSSANDGGAASPTR